MLRQLLVQISRDLDTLNQSDQDALKSSLLSWLAASARAAYPKSEPPSGSERGKAARLPTQSQTHSTITAVYTKLCVAVSSLSLHRQPKGEWDNWLLESTMTLSGTACSKEAVYELLVIAVEEANRADLIGKAKSVFFLFYLSCNAFSCDSDCILLQSIV